MFGFQDTAHDFNVVRMQQLGKPVKYFYISLLNFSEMHGKGTFEV